MQSTESLYLITAIATFCFIIAGIQTIYILRRKFSLKRQIKECQNDCQPPQPISVIVFTDKTNSCFLEQSIPAIMEQSHPDFEVIVINSDSFATTDDILTRLSIKYPSIRTTFIPDTSCNVSIRKLSATLGIKAASNELILMTDADCIPKSKEWLTRMSQKFDGTTGAVIGYCHNGHDNTAGHRYREFDTVMTDSQYLASAIRGHAFRGDRRNLALRKSAFFDNKGYSRTMNLKYGDDDIFLNEIKRFSKIKVELSEESILESKYPIPANFYISDKLHRMFTIGKINPKAIIASRTMTLLRFFYLLSLACLICAGILFLLQNTDEWILPAILTGYSVIIYLTEAIIHILSYRSIAKMLQAPKLFFTIPIFRVWRPIANLRFRSLASRSDNYTWE